jgi:ParB family chromosome partitioning protein
MLSTEGQSSDGPGVQRTAISVAGSATDTDDDEEDGARPLPDRLVTELTAHRTLVIA